MTTPLERSQDLRREAPRLRARDATARLGATEAALVACGATGPASPLRPDRAALIGALGGAGRVMALTRNEHAVHERRGRYEEVSAGPGHILALGPDVDLRLFPKSWAHAYALGDERPSIQVFDRDGAAVHKVFAAEETNRGGWDAVVAAFRAERAAPPPEAPPAPGAALAAAAEGDVVDEGALRDPHDFFRLLRRHGATRRQAFGLAGGDLALPLAPDAGSAALRLAAGRGLPVMVFVGNRGAIQIHTGPVRRPVPTPDGWFNVLDADFNLHLRETGLAAAWRVVKPADDGAVTSVELLDAIGEVVALIFGARKPGQREREDWRAGAAAVAERHAATPAAEGAA